METTDNGLGWPQSFVRAERVNIISTTPSGLHTALQTLIVAHKAKLDTIKANRAAEMETMSAAEMAWADAAIITLAAILRDLNRILKENSAPTIQTL